MDCVMMFMFLSLTRGTSKLVSDRTCLGLCHDVYVSVGMSMGTLVLEFVRTYI